MNIRSKKPMGQSVETSIDLSKQRRSERRGLAAGPRGAAASPVPAAAASSRRGTPLISAQPATR